MGEGVLEGGLERSFVMGVEGVWREVWKGGSEEGLEGFWRECLEQCLEAYLEEDLERCLKRMEVWRMVGRGVAATFGGVVGKVFGERF